MSDPLARAHAFALAMRHAGLPADARRVQALVAALVALGPAGLYWAGRLTLCASQEDIARFDDTWRRLTGGAAPAGPPVPRPRPRRHTRLLADGVDAGERSPDDQQQPVASRASATETLRQRDLAELTPAERDEVRRLLALLVPAAPRRPSRRHRPAARGRVDRHGTIRATLQGLGEPARLRHRQRRRRPRRLVLLLDVSGSMALYADALLRFAHAAVRARPRHTEVFTLGTRLTSVTTALRARDPDAAVRGAGAEVVDWRGGTRLGDTLTAYLRTFGHRGTARRAVVVVCSDGWECGDAATLGRAMAWLSRLAHRVIWVTPHAARPGFAPSVAGLAAAYPHLDELRAGHSVAALGELITSIARH